MNILAIDTSTKFLVIALGDKQGMVFGCRRDVGLRHSVLLFPLLQRLLDKYNIRKRDIDLLAVGLGPGSFTGLRVSLAAVKAMALGWGKKAVCGLASLDIIAHGVNKDGRISVILDARRGNVYAADYDNRAGRILRIGSYRLVSFERWLKDIFVTASRQKIFVAGDGLRIYADRLYGRDNIVCLSEKYWFPRPEEFLSLAGEDIACRQDFIRNVAAITPIYLYSKECQIK